MKQTIPGWLRRSIAAAMLIGLAALFGCWTPEMSLSPLHTEKNVVLDDTIVGTWLMGEESTSPRIGQRLGEWKPGDRRLDFARSPHENAKSYFLTQSLPDKGSAASEVHLLRLGNYMFINVEPRFPGPKEPTVKFPFPMMPVHWLGRITVTKNALLIRMMPAQTIAALQRRGKLPLQRAEQHVLTSPTADLQKFALEHADDATIFPLNVVLCRQGADCTVEVPLAVVKTQPPKVDWSLSLAIGYMLRDRYADAWATWNQLLAAERPPEDTGVNYLRYSENEVLSLAEAFMDWGYAGSGISVLKTLTKRDSQPNSFRALGYGYLHLNRPREAQAAFRQATALAVGQELKEPGFTIPRAEELAAREKAATFILMGDFEKARAEAAKCSSYSVQCRAQSKRLAFLTYFAEGNYAAASKLSTEGADPAVEFGIYGFLLQRHLGRSQQAHKGSAKTGKQKLPVIVEAELENPVEKNKLSGTYQYFGGKLSDSQFLARIHPLKGRVVVPELCTAYCLIGERHLLRGDRAGARKYFQKSVDTHAFTYAAWVIANARVKQLSRN